MNTKQGTRSVWVSPLAESAWTPVNDLDKKINASVESRAAYSNFCHEFDDKACALLSAESVQVAQHAAWEYCGWIWKDGRVFREQVRRHGVPIAEYESNDLRTLIRHVVEKHGSE